MAGAHGTADEPAQHVAATLVAWKDAVGVAEDEHGAAQVVGEDPQCPLELGVEVMRLSTPVGLRLAIRWWMASSGAVW